MGSAARSSRRCASVKPIATHILGVQVLLGAILAPPALADLLPPANFHVPFGDFDGHYEVSWDADPEVDTYKLEGKLVSDPAWTLIQNSASTSAEFIDQADGTYVYQVSSCVSGSCGNPTSPSSIYVEELQNVESVLPGMALAGSAGWISFSASVSDDGSAIVEIPIEVPRGLNGLQPDLSLLYSSAGGQELSELKRVAGYIGYGWDLSGIPVIRRCRASIDSANVDLTVNDGLCLDDQPLVLKSGTSYWADDASYRTEIQSFVNVVAQGTGTNRWFKVYLPDGGVQEFGGTTESRATARNSSTVYSWGLSKHTDERSNVLDVTWELNTASGNHFPYQIDYANAQIVLHYQERLDASSVMLGSSIGGTTRREVFLNRVVVNVANTKVREYRVLGTYSSANLNEAQLLADYVQLCGYAEGGGAEACQAALVVNWAQPIADHHSPFRNVIAAVDNGLGDTWEFDYAVIDGNDSNHVLDIAVHSHFGTFTAPAGIETRAAQRALVSESRRPDGNHGSLTTNHRYTGLPYYDSEGRGFVGFQQSYEFHNRHAMYNPTTGTSSHESWYLYKQHRLDFPFYGRIARTTGATRLEQHAAYFTHLRQEWDWAQHDDGTSTFPFVARSYERNHEPTATGSYMWSSAREIEISYCFRSFSGDTCPTSGTEQEFMTQRITITRTGNTLTAGSSTASVWGDVDQHQLNNVQSYEQHVENLDNNDSSTLRAVHFVNQFSASQGVSSPVFTQEVERLREATYSNALNTVQVFPADPEHELTTTLGYTADGEVDGTTTTGVDISSQWTSASGFEAGLYPQTLTNEEGHVTSLTYDLRHGLPKTGTDANGNVATTTYDAFGRVIQVTEPDGTVITSSYESCASVDCSMVSWALPRLRITQEFYHASTQVAPSTRQYLDGNGQVVLEAVQAFAGSDGWRRVETHYYPDGHVEKRSQPYHSNSGVAPQYTTYHYGFRGRLEKEVRPNGSTVTTDYTGTGVGELTALTVDSGDGQQKRAKFNALGQLVETTDGYGSATAVTTVYDYEERGLLDKVHVDGVLITDQDYDAAGNRIRIDEVSSGITTFDFDALGRVILKTDAKGQKTSYSYDNLGRLIGRIDDYEGVDPISNSWIYDTATNGIGLLASRSNPYLTETLSYDALSRLQTRAFDLSVPGYPGNGIQTISYGYDGSGRLFATTYPDSVEFTRTFTWRGYRSQIRSSSNYLDHVVAMNASGQVTEAQYVNGMITTWSYDDTTGLMTGIETGTSTAPRSVQDLTYGWQPNGTLHQRIDQRDGAADAIETFSYDALNRLTSAVTSGAVSRTKIYDYDASGNLLYKTSSVGGDVDATGYTYSDAYHLAAVVIAGQQISFSYDANGNLIHYARDGSGDDRFIDYDAANQAVRITEGVSSDTLSPTARDEYWYGPDGERLVRKSTWDDGGTQKVTWVSYLDDGRYERVYPVHDASTDYVAKMMPTENVLYRFIKDSTGGTSTATEFLHRDHLGSIDSITHWNGEFRSLAYDPFGSRRAADWSSDATVGELATAQADLDEYTQHGFTDHEHLDRTGIIHMKGRIYDPLLGRFLQPDPIVQDPTLSQSYDRYAYVVNSPLSLTDPYGYFAAGGGSWIGLAGINSGLGISFGFPGINFGFGGYFGAPDVASIGPLIRLGPWLNRFVKRAIDRLRGIKPTGLPVPRNLPRTINRGHQNKHVPGANGYDKARSSLGKGVDPNELLAGVHSGKYLIVRKVSDSKYVVDFGRNIGSFKATPQSPAVPTQYGMVHAGKNGAHIVPASPVQVY